MATQITPRGSLSFTVDSSTGGISGPTPGTLAFDFTAPPKFHDERQSLSTALDDLDFSDVGWTNTTWAMLKNHSATTGENINVLMWPNLVAGMTSAGTVAGASLPATQTGPGYYQIISADGTSVSPARAWKKGDIAIYLGSSGTYAQVRPKGLILKPGETAGPFRIQADGIPWKVFADAGTPQIGKIAAGACA